MVYSLVPKWLLPAALAACVILPAAAQKSDSSASSVKDSKPAAQGEVDPLKRPVPAAKSRKQQKALMKELEPAYKTWLNEDVAYIITDEERQAFFALSNDEERDQFIEQFWLRRDPTPDTVENEYKEEHYRRIAYANEHFAAGIPGWKTDRGRMYITFGPADEIESHPSGGFYQRPQEEGGGSTSTYPFEQWRYRYLEGIGQEIIVEFVDQCSCGAYTMEIDRSKKDALKNVPGAGLTTYEEMGLASKADRFAGFEQLGRGPFNQNEGSKIFDRLDTYAKLQKAPPVKFKDLEEVVTHKIRFNTMPFEVRADFVKVTTDTALVPITIQLKNRDITFVNKDGVQRGVVNIFGRVTTLTGRIAQTFEDPVSVDQPAELLPKILDNSVVYWKALPLKSGRYRVDIVVKDVNGDRVGTWSRGIVVPEYNDDKLAASTLILADQMERVDKKQVGTGNFVIGQTKVRPRVEPADGKPALFKRKERVNLWMQVYNLGLDKATNKPDAVVEYDVVNAATNKAVVHAVESTKQMGNVGDQLTLEKSLPLTTLEPGLYRVSIKVSDNISKQQPIVQNANFSVE
jgi:GWxTD domain-containing protein